jgi:hypothetical protein
LDTLEEDWQQIKDDAGLIWDDEEEDWTFE